jgi:hypothetical protein
MLGIEVKWNHWAGTISLSQCSYIESILHCFSLTELKLLSTPFDTQVRLTSKQAPADVAEFVAMQDVLYHKAIGTLNWAMLATRPDIAFAVLTVACFSTNLGLAHWEAIKCIFCYLLGTRNLWLTYREQSCPLTGYTDADGSMGKDHKAITGYAFLIDGGTVSWSSKKQEIVSLSTTESEYAAVTHRVKEVLWLRNLLHKVFHPHDKPIDILCNNQSVIALTQDSQYHSHTKHIDMRYHFIH